jgi:hypothetical protein
MDTNHGLKDEEEKAKVEALISSIFFSYFGVMFYFGQ